MKTLNKIFLAAALLTSGGAFAEGLASKHSAFSLELGAGLPQLISLQADFSAGPSFEFGLGAGIAPISGMLNNKIGLAPTAVDLGTADQYQLTPSSTFYLFSFYPFLRYYPWAGGFYVQAAFAVMVGSSDISGTLQDTTTGQSYANVITGSFDCIKSSLTLSIGYRPYLAPSFFINFGAGLSWYHNFDYHLSVGGTLPSSITATPSGQQRFNQALTGIENQMGQTLGQYQNSPTVYPSANFSLGWGF